MSIFSRKSVAEKQNCEYVEQEIETISEERLISQSEKIEQENSAHSKFPTGDKSADLMILIGKAINQWAEIYHLQGMPTKVVFGQVLALMTAWYKNLK